MNGKALVAACALAVASASASTVTNLTVRSGKMGRDIPVTVVLPDAYDGAARFPSVYVLHGAGGNNLKGANPIVTNLVDRYGFVAIAPDGGKTSWWLDSPIDPTYQYETFVIRELVPFVDAHYRTVDDRKSRGIMGGSMGGHGACYLGIRHKDVFGVKEYSKLTPKVQEFLEQIESDTGCPVGIISTGPEQSQIIDIRSEL